MVQMRWGPVIWEPMMAGALVSSFGFIDTCTSTNSPHGRGMTPPHNKRCPQLELTIDTNPGFGPVLGPGIDAWLVAAAGRQKPCVSRRA